MRQELFYFSSSNVMIRVNYDQAKNRCTYEADRDVDFPIHQVIEKYLHENVINPSGSIYAEPCDVDYLGVAPSLKQEVKKFHDRQAKKQQQRGQEQFQNRMNRQQPNRDEIFGGLTQNNELNRPDVKDAVAGLLNNTATEKTALFNAIGDLLLERSQQHNPAYKLDKLNVLVTAYNRLVSPEETISLSSLLKQE